MTNYQSVWMNWASTHLAGPLAESLLNRVWLIGWTTTDEGGHRRHMVSAHLRWMKMAPGEVCSDGALEAAVTWRLSLIESDRFKRGCRKAGMCQGHIFVVVYSPIWWGVSLSALVSFWLCIFFVDIEAGLLKIHYLKKPTSWCSNVF